MKLSVWLLIGLFLCSCVDERPYLYGHIRRAHDALMVPCDPYNLDVLHTCVVFSAAFQEALYVYDATAGEMVLSPMAYFPLKVKVGRVTDDLVAVISKNPKFPWMLALDHAEPAVYPVRLFPKTDKKELSFITPQPQNLDDKPFKIAALEKNNEIILVQTYPDKQQIGLSSLDQAGQRKQALKLVAVAGNPNYIDIDKDGTAVITDKGSNNIYAVDLAAADIDGFFSDTAALAIVSVDVKMKTDRIYLSQRDFGAGSHLYALVFEAAGNKIKLIDVTNKAEAATYEVAEAPVAGYFPDQQSDPCCGGKKHWLSVVTIKGNLYYFPIEYTAGPPEALALKKPTKVKLTSEANLALKKLEIKKILGGKVEQDSLIKREKICPNHRQSFYIAAFGSGRSYRGHSSVEQEAHGFSCEGESTASLLGSKID